jgi:HSP20 family molecular chaperone IbpA
MADILTITFNPCIDKSISISSLAPEKKLHCSVPTFEPGGGGIKYSRKEYNYSSFCRSFTLPKEVNKDIIEATYEGGILNLIIPKMAESKVSSVKEIAVK